MAEDKLGENLIFVCGCGHSGTTLLWAMLSSHSRIYGIPYETNVFLNSRKRNTKSLSFIRKFLVVTFFKILSKSAQRKFVSFERNGYLSFTRTDSNIIAFFNDQSAQARILNKELICEKTPRHMLKIDRIKRIFPRSSIIVIVRNGLDVTGSLKERRGNFDNAMDRWINDNRTMLKFKDRHLLKIVKYEDLIREPERELRKVCDFCHLKYEDNMLSYHNSPSSKKWDYDIRRKQVIQPIMDRSNRWKGILSDSEVSKFKENAGDLMNYFGYEIIQ